jgi:thiol-disulfide isomerase/thioredoxin
MMKKVLLAVSLAACLTATSFAQSIPRPAGAWSAQTVDKKILRLEQFRGKYVVLAFLLVTCPHCQRFTGTLNQIQQEYGRRGVQVVAGTVGQAGTADLADFAQKFSPAFPIGAMDQNGVNSFGEYGMQRRTFYPMAFFIDKTGVVQAQFMGGESLFEGDPLTNVRAVLDRLLATSGQPAAKKAPPAAAKK